MQQPQQLLRDVMLDWKPDWKVRHAGCVRLRSGCWHEHVQRRQLGVQDKMPHLHILRVAEASDPDCHGCCCLEHVCMHVNSDGTLHDNSHVTIDFGGLSWTWPVTGQEAHSKGDTFFTCVRPFSFSSPSTSAPSPSSSASVSCKHAHVQAMRSKLQQWLSGADAWFANDHRAWEHTVQSSSLPEWSQPSLPSTSSCSVALQTACWSSAPSISGSWMSRTSRPLPSLSRL